MQSRFAATTTLLSLAILAALPASASPIIQGNTQYWLIPDGVTQAGIWCGFGVSSDPTSSNPCTFINPNNGGEATAVGSAELVTDGALGSSAALDLTNVSSGLYRVQSLVSFQNTWILPDLQAFREYVVTITLGLDGGFNNPAGVFSEDVRVGLNRDLWSTGPTTTNLVAQDVSFQGTIVPIQSGDYDYNTFLYLQTLVQSAGTDDLNGLTASGMADFARTLTLKSVTVFDATSQTDVTPSQILDGDGDPVLPSASTPEPSGLLLFGFGATAVAARLRRLA